MYRYVRSSNNIIIDMKHRWNSDVSKSAKNLEKCENEFEDVKKVLNVDDSYYETKYRFDYERAESKLEDDIKRVLHKYSLYLVGKFNYKEGYVYFKIACRGDEYPAYGIKFTYDPIQSVVNKEHEFLVTHFESKVNLKDVINSLKSCDSNNMYYLYQYRHLRHVTKNVPLLSDAVYTLCSELKRLKGKYLIQSTSDSDRYCKIKSVNSKNGICQVDYRLCVFNKDANKFEEVGPMRHTKDSKNVKNPYYVFSRDMEFPTIVSKERKVKQKQMSLFD